MMAVLLAGGEVDSQLFLKERSQEPQLGKVLRSAIYIKVVRLGVFTVVGLAVGRAQQTFFQNRVATIPQSQLEA